MKLELMVANRLTEIERVNHAFNHFARQNGFPDEVRRKINLVIDELLNNIINYAFGDRNQHLIQVQFVYKDPDLILEVTDDGVPFDLLSRPVVDVHQPIEEREVGGLGIHLIRQIMDDLQYVRAHQKNTTTLIKNIRQLRKNDYEDQNH
ncbi:MAG: ATP-binding protein [Bacteroidota bacterium]